MDAHPPGTFRPGRLPTREVEPIAADDQQRLLDACDPRSTPGLRVADLDLASGEVRVRGGKDARDRTVALGQRARSMVDRYLQRAPVAGRPGLGPGVSDAPAPAVDALHPRARAQAAGGAADLANIHPHRFRHTFGVT